MSKRVFLRRAETLLPGKLSLEDIFFGNRSLPTELYDTAGILAKNVQVSLLSDETLKDINAERIVRRTTERQSRWLVATGVRSWRSAFGDELGGDDTGLFLGLGTVDCDDAPEFHFIEYSTAPCLSKVLLDNNKPLTGLILLNSTATSHIAQMTGITGENACFSPMVDAGANALVEAVSCVREGLVSRALCGGGSQKITPWFFLAYENLLTERSVLWVSEAAAFVLISDSANQAHVEVLSVNRSRLCAPKHGIIEVLRDAVFELEGFSDVNLVQVVSIGLHYMRDQTSAALVKLGFNTPIVHLEDKLGDCAAAAALIGMNLTTYLFEQRAVITGSYLRSMPEGANNVVMLLVCGPANQISYLLIGGACE